MDKYCEIVWDKLEPRHQNHLLRLMLKNGRVEAIKQLRRITGLGLIEARDFIDSAWMRKKVAEFDPTRMTPLEELKSKVLQVVTDMLNTVNDPEMLVRTKYEILTETEIPKLFGLCMEE